MTREALDWPHCTGRSIGHRGAFDSDHSLHNSHTFKSMHHTAEEVFSNQDHAEAAPGPPDFLPRLPSLRVSSAVEQTQPPTP